ncbi:Protein FAM172A [Anabarilius grahami]|uniref:Protein FAM172A n=1 Tax=Anabarilius grahami TaxID=495550 RepID=A0A3N0Y427_ANAGA|nr:Protein FAM172A [Anabarilius grahami]
MTDSVHNVWHQEANKPIQDWLREWCDVHQRHEDVETDHSQNNSCENMGNA